MANVTNEFYAIGGLLLISNLKTHICQFIWRYCWFAELLVPSIDDFQVFTQFYWSFSNEFSFYKLCMMQQFHSHQFFPNPYPSSARFWYLSQSSFGSSKVISHPILFPFIIKVKQTSCWRCLSSLENNMRRRLFLTVFARKKTRCCSVMVKKSSK